MKTISLKETMDKKHWKLFKHLKRALNNPVLFSSKLELSKKDVEVIAHNMACIVCWELQKCQ